MKQKINFKRLNKVTSERKKGANTAAEKNGPRVLCNPSRRLGNNHSRARYDEGSIGLI
jgi:hypothetical protein